MVRGGPLIMGLGGWKETFLDEPRYQVWVQSHASNPFIRGAQVQRLYIKKKIDHRSTSPVYTDR